MVVDELGGLCQTRNCTGVKMQTPNISDMMDDFDELSPRRLSGNPSNFGQACSNANPVGRMLQIDALFVRSEALA